MNILVTGAKGFIGRHLIRHLKNKTNHHLFEFNRDDHIDDLKNIVPKLILFIIWQVNRSKDKKLFQRLMLTTHKLYEFLSANRKIKLLYASQFKLPIILITE